MYIVAAYCIVYKGGMHVSQVRHICYFDHEGVQCWMLECKFIRVEDKSSKLEPGEEFQVLCGRATGERKAGGRQFNRACTMYM